MAALEEVRRSETVKFLVLRGADDIFCAGDDLRGLEGFAANDGTWAERRPAAIDFWSD